MEPWRNPTTSSRGGRPCKPGVSSASGGRRPSSCERAASEKSARRRPSAAASSMSRYAYAGRWCATHESMSDSNSDGGGRVPSERARDSAAIAPGRASGEMSIIILWCATTPPKHTRSTPRAASLGARGGCGATPAASAKLLQGGRHEGVQRGPLFLGAVAVSKGPALLAESSSKHLDARRRGCGCKCCT